MSWKNTSGLREHSLKKGVRVSIPSDLSQWSEYDTLRVTYEQCTGGDRGYIRLYALGNNGHNSHLVEEIFVSGIEETKDISDLARSIIRSDVHMYRILCITSPVGDGPTTIRGGVIPLGPKMM